MSKSIEQLEARKLRGEGTSIKNIAKILDVSKSSVSYWCRDIKLTKKQIKSLELKAYDNRLKGRMLGTQKNKQKKLDSVNKEANTAKKIVGQLSSREKMIAGVACYWGEGTKAETSQLGFCNSDPKMMRFMVSWFKEVFQINTKEFMPRILINQVHQPRIQEITNFWSKYLKIPIHQFRKPTFTKIELKKKYANHANYNGVLMLRIMKSTKLKYRILGMIDAIKSEC